MWHHSLLLRQRNIEFQATNYNNKIKKKMSLDTPSNQLSLTVKHLTSSLLINYGVGVGVGIGVGIGAGVGFYRSCQ